MIMTIRPFGPKQAHHPSIGEKCPACPEPFAVGDYTTLVTLGPGNDREERRKAREGLAHNAVAIEVHWACATGEEGDEEIIWLDEDDPEPETDDPDDDDLVAAR